MERIVEHLDRATSNKSARALIWLTLVVGIVWTWRQIDLVRDAQASNVVKLEDQVSDLETTMSSRIKAVETQAQGQAALLEGVALTLCYSAPREAARSRLPCKRLEIEPLR